MKYIVILDTNEADFLQVVDNDSWRSALSIYKATPFNSKEEAKAKMEDLMIKSLYPKAIIQAVHPSYFPA